MFSNRDTAHWLFTYTVNTNKKYDTIGCNSLRRARKENAQERKLPWALTRVLRWSSESI